MTTNLTTKYDLEELYDSKDKRFSFFSDPQKKEKLSHIWHIAFCPTQKSTPRKSQRAKSSGSLYFVNNFSTF